MEGRFLFKVHKSYRWVVAVCDEELYGKRFEEGKRQLDLTGAFFRGELIGEKKLKSEIFKCIREDATFNIVGQKSVEIAKELGMIDKEDILKVGNIPFILTFL